MSSRPTPEQIAEARRDVQASLEYNVADINALRVLLAATEPPTDEEIRAAFSEVWSAPEVYYEENRHKVVSAVIRKLFGPVKP